MISFSFAACVSYSPDFTAIGDVLVFISLIFTHHKTHKSSKGHPFYDQVENQVDNIK